MYIISQNRYEELLQQNKMFPFQQAKKCNFDVYNVKNTVPVYLLHIIFRRARFVANIICKSLTRIFAACVLYTLLLIAENLATTH